MCVCASILDESPRWLMSRGQLDKAAVVLRRIARVNKRPLPADLCLLQTDYCSVCTLIQLGMSVLCGIFKNMWTVQTLNMWRKYD